MRLTELDPQFYRYERVVRKIEVVIGDPVSWKSGDPTKVVRRICHDSIPVQTIAEAQSIWFLCPKCVDGSHHMIECTIAGRGVDDAVGSHNKAGKPTRWSISGTDFSNLSLSPSILIEDGCNWHGFVTNGEIQ